MHNVNDLVTPIFFVVVAYLSYGTHDGLIAHLFLFTFATAKYSSSLIGSAVAMNLSFQKRCFHPPLKGPV